MIRALIQAIVVFIIALLFIYLPGVSGLSLQGGFSALDMILMVAILFLLALGFAALFTSIALAVENQETLMGIVNLLNLPLMFASSALFPTSMMPDWLKTVANYKPITFAGDGLRQIAFNNPDPVYSLGVDILGLTIFALGLVGVGWLVAKHLMNR